MAKIIYVIMENSEPIVAFEDEEQAKEFRQIYIIDNYGTEYDVEAAQSTLTIETTYLQNK